MRDTTYVSNSGFVNCSKCNKSLPTKRHNHEPKYPFCPWCGAPISSEAVLPKKVVLCKDCRYYSSHEWVVATDVEHVCHFWHGELTKVAPDGFCAWGEREER